MKREGWFRFELRNYGIYALLFNGVAILIGVIGWHYQTRLREEEKVDVVVVAKEANQPSFQNEFKKRLNENKPERLYTIEYRFVATAAQERDQVLATYGALTGDLFILPESVFSSWGTSSLLSLSSDTCAALFGEGLVYDSSSEPYYGIVVSNDILSKDETYYLSFGKDSPHLGALKKQEDDAAVVLARSLL